MGYGKKKKIEDINNSLMSNNKLIVTIKFLKKTIVCKVNYNFKLTKLLF
jgi:hypothetical protein